MLVFGGCENALAPSLPCDSTCMQLFIEALAIIDVIIKDRFQRIIRQLQLTEAFRHSLCTASPEVDSVLLHRR